MSDSSEYWNTFPSCSKSFNSDVLQNQAWVTVLYLQDYKHMTIFHSSIYNGDIKSSYVIERTASASICTWNLFI